MNIPAGVLQIAQILHSHGYKCFVVGGAVRDFLLGKEIKDFDLVTDAYPETLKQIFPDHSGRTRPEFVSFAGNRFGVSRLRSIEGEHIETATFRTDGEYLDGKLVKVDFTNEIEDVKRRDFTINALLWDIQKGEVVDHVGGMKDLKEKTLRSVGDAALRFKEDPIRMLRAIRIAIRIGLTIEAKTFEAIQKDCALIKLMPKERQAMEFNKILNLDPELGFRLLIQSGLLFEMFPIKKTDSWIHQIKNGASPQLYWLMILENTAKDGKFDPEVLTNLTSRDRRMVTEVKTISEKMVGSTMGYLRSVADGSYYDLSLEYLKLNGRDTTALELAKKEIVDTPINRECFLNGFDLEDMGYERGPIVGQIQKELSRAIYGREVKNKAETIEFVKTNFPKV